MRRDVLEKIVKEYKRDKSFYFKLSEDLKEKQMQNALKKICCDSNIGISKIVALMDTTILENGKNGYLLTEQYLYGKFEKQKIPLDGMSSYRMIKNDRIKLYYQDNREVSFYISIYREFEDFIQRIIQAQNTENVQGLQSVQNSVNVQSPKSVQGAEKVQALEDAQRMGQNQRLVNILKSILVIKEQEAVKPEPPMPKVAEKKPEPAEQKAPENERKADKGFLYGSRESREKLRAENTEKIKEIRLQITRCSEVYEFEKAVCLRRTAAELGDDDSLVELSDCYYYGIGVQRDAEKAKEILRQAKQMGVASAVKNMEEIKALEELDENKLFEKAVFEIVSPHRKETYLDMAHSRGIYDDWYAEEMEDCGEEYEEIGLDVRAQECYLKAAESGS